MVHFRCGKLRLAKGHSFAASRRVDPLDARKRVNYNELTTSSLEIIVSKGNHPQMALIQVSEIL